MGRRAFLITAVLLACSPKSAAAYSVLAHEALIDDVWSAQIAPLLMQKFPRASAHELQVARGRFN